MLLVDTSVWIDLIAGHHTAATAFVAAQEAHDDIALTEFTYLEVLQGVREDKVHATLRDWLAQQTILTPLNGLETFDYAAQLYRRARKRGYTIRSTLDCLLAAQAIERNAMLVHNDRDFLWLAAVEKSLSIYPHAAIN
jgi:predicted nucleic acid-binding protein